MITQYLRRVQKRSSVAGQVPTIPVSNDHTDGTWLVTDIYDGERFVNLVDKKMYTRCGNTIVQENIDEATLAYILANMHTKNTDLYLDFGGANQVSAADIKLKLHTQNTDTILDDGGTNEVSASEIRTFIDSKGQPLGVVPLNASGIIDDQYLSIQSLAKGTIAVNTDFPLLSDVQKYWWYQVTATVIDNVPLHTNTGLTFNAGDEIYWDGVTWQPYGNLQTSDRQPQIIVKTETQLINAYNTLKTTGGGTIVFGDNIALTANRAFDNSGIKVFGNGYDLSFSGYTISITNRSCYFENIRFVGDGVTTVSIFNFSNTTYSTSQFVFFNCRFHNCVESNYNTVGVLNSSGFVGSFHVVFSQCNITSSNTINTNYLSIKLYGNTSSASSITVLGCKSVQTSKQTNLFGFIGSLYDSGNNFITDGSGIYSGISLGVSDKNYCIIDSPFFTTRDSINARDNSDYLTVLDITDNKIKKILVSDFISGITGSSTFSSLTDVDVTGITSGDLIYWNGTKYTKLTPTYLSNITTDNSASGTGTLTNPLVVKLWRTVEGTPVRVSNTQFTITDTSNLKKLDKVLCKGTVLKWTDSGNTKMACVYSSSYATNTVTVNIYGDVLNAGFTNMEFHIQKAIEVSFSLNGYLSYATTDIMKPFKFAKETKIFFIQAEVMTAGSGGSGTTYIDTNANLVSITSDRIALANTDTVNIKPINDGTTITSGTQITFDLDSVLTTPTTYPQNLCITLFTFPLNNQFIS